MRQVSFYFHLLAISLLFFSVIGEINDNIPYLVPAASNQEHDIWVWNSEDKPQIENICNECTSVSIKGEPAINRIE